MLHPLISARSEAGKKKKVGKRFESGADEGMLFWGEGAGGRPGVSDFVSG